MAKIRLKDGTEIDSEKVYDYSDGADSFEENFKDNQKWWSESPEEAHSAQERNVGALDKETGGKSTYTPSTGVWNLSDGRKSDANGISGNSYLSPYFDRKKTEGYKRSREAREKYFDNEFSYDPERDELYRQYKERYIEGGQNAADDAIARSAMRTGGMASSYATTAGALAYQDYMKGLNDKIPELSELAYQKWEDEQARLREEAEYGENMTSDEYSDWAMGRSAYLDKRDSDLAYRIAMNKAQTNGFDSLSDSERAAIYSSGGYYDPKRDEIIDENGINYETGIRPKIINEAAENSADKSADSRIAAILLKAKNAKNGVGSLSVSELTDLIDAGYDVDGLNITAPSSSGRKSTGKSSGGGSSYSGNPGGYTTPSTEQSTGQTETRQAEPAKFNGMSENEVIQGIAQAYVGQGTTQEEKMKYVEEYLDSVGIPAYLRNSYINKFVAMYR